MKLWMADNAGKPELVDSVRQAIGQSPAGMIPFHDYMEMCLYHPQFGYYSDERPKVGKEGDFYTSAGIGGVMAEMVARAYDKLAPEGPGQFVEFGGGTGAMARRLLDTLRADAPEAYAALDFVLVERSPYHRARQRAELAAHAERIRFLSEEEWLRESPPKGAVVFSNELLDAFPVHRIRLLRGELQELCVGWDAEKGRFAERTAPLANPDVRAYLAREGIALREGQTAEVNLHADAWIRRVLHALAEGTLLTVDYGGAAEELYAPHRMNGTLMCYRSHMAHDDPYVHAGEQDITAHVNFSACIRAGREAGAGEERLMTQKQFLIEAGVFDLLRNHPGTDPFGPEAKRNRAVRQLLLSDGMSELFKVLIQTKKR